MIYNNIYIYIYIYTYNIICFQENLICNTTVIIIRYIIINY